VEHGKFGTGKTSLTSRVWCAPAVVDVGDVCLVHFDLALSEGGIESGTLQEGSGCRAKEKNRRKSGLKAVGDQRPPYQ
jgi:hypothetical protein